MESSSQPWSPHLAAQTIRWKMSTSRAKNWLDVFVSKGYTSSSKNRNPTLTSTPLCPKRGSSTTSSGGTGSLAGVIEPSSSSRKMFATTSGSVRVVRVWFLKLLLPVGWSIWNKYLLPGKSDSGKNNTSVRTKRKSKSKSDRFPTSFVINFKNCKTIRIHACMHSFIHWLHWLVILQP